MAEFASIRNADRLTWERVSLFARTYQIKTSTSVVGTFKLGLAGRTAQAEFADGSWLLKRRGIFRLTMYVIDARTQAELATMKFRFRRGILTLASGKPYHWRPMGFFSRETGLFTDSDMPVVSLKPMLFSLRGKGEINVRREYASLPELTLLVAVGTYAALLAQGRGHAS
jgi:hypothetical protein